MRCAASTPRPFDGKNSRVSAPRHRPCNIHAYSSGISCTARNLFGRLFGGRGGCSQIPKVLGPGRFPAGRGAKEPAEIRDLPAVSTVWMKGTCERGEENVEAHPRSRPVGVTPGPHRSWSVKLWMAEGVINRQRTPLSSSSTQAVRRTIASMRSRSDTDLDPRDLELRDLDREALAVADLGTEWQELAECAKQSGEVDFFPARGESVRDAKEVCARCAVKSECLDFALRLKVAHGVWGGLSERERRLLRRERHRLPSC
jgi:WhiB family transcriptional regulator, redox-sensing transcriptional regulator